MDIIKNALKQYVFQTYVLPAIVVVTIILILYYALKKKDTFMDPTTQANNIYNFMKNKQTPPSYQQFKNNINNADAVEYTESVKLAKAGKLNVENLIGAIA